jgi:tRNA G37 N-methylase Trm5
MNINQFYHNAVKASLKPETLNLKPETQNFNKKQKWLNDLLKLPHPTIIKVVLKENKNLELKILEYKKYISELKQRYQAFEHLSLSHLRELSKENKAILKEVMKDEILKRQEEEIIKIRTENNKLREENYQLIGKIALTKKPETQNPKL